MIYGQLAQLVSVLFNSYREVTSSIPAEAFIFNCNFFMLYYIREVVPRSLRSPRGVHGVYGESTESPHGIHEMLFHGVLMESTVFQTVPLDSMGSLRRLLMDSTWTPHRVLVDYWESVGNGLWSPQRLLMESLWSPHGLHEDSLRSPQRLLRVFVESMETRGGV
jgi:hypothetical protein